MRTIVALLVAVLLILAFLIVISQPETPETTTTSTTYITSSTVTSVQSMYRKLGNLPSPSEFGFQTPTHPSIQISPKMKSKLPLSLSDLVNPELLEQLELNPSQRDALLKRGFVFRKWGKYKDLSEAYSYLKNANIPIYVTVDSFLHAYHVQFDSILAEIEENYLYEDLINMSKALLNSSLNDLHTMSGDYREAARRNVAFFSVALSLLDPSFKPPSEVSELVNEEVKLIEEHGGIRKSPIFHYKEDYSQYRPRGHYTKSEKLKRYFKAMMWYGRMAFLLRKGFVSEADSKIATLQAVLISTELPSSTYNNEKASDLWLRIYSVTSFFVGLADDLTPYDYLEALKELFGKEIDLTKVKDEINALRAELAKRGKPKIYGGTGSCVVYPPFTEDKLEECLDKSAGMRLMGQRYVPDSYVLGKLITPSVGLYVGNNRPFTLGYTNGGLARVFPRGLDWFAVIGSDRALQIIREEGDAEYERYEQVLEKLREEFSQVDWSKNLYWSWLDVLRLLTTPKGEEYPAFMRTPYWESRQLHSALASWAELRHDTILYAKQSYTPRLAAAPPTPKIKGFVEPLPEVYARLESLVNQTIEGLKKLGYLDQDMEARLGSLSWALKRAKEISIKELSGEELAEEDIMFAVEFGELLDDIMRGLDERTKATVLIADVHTDLNSGLVLEEGVGKLDLIVVAFPYRGGHHLVVGPILTYYEFKHPMSDRLTDEAWLNLLETEEPHLAPWQLSLYDTSSG